MICHNLFLQEELFSKGGFHEELVAIRDTLDTGVPEAMRIL